MTNPPTPTMDLAEQVARIIRPDAFRTRDRHYAEIDRLVAEGHQTTERAVELKRSADMYPGRAFATANTILDLITSARSVGGDVVELREALEKAAKALEHVDGALLAMSEAMATPGMGTWKFVTKTAKECRAVLSRIEAGGGSLQPQAASVPTEQADRAVVACDVPPSGWSCSREPGHDGPCAAKQDCVFDTVETLSDRLSRSSDPDARHAAIMLRAMAEDIPHPAKSDSSTGGAS